MISVPAGGSSGGADRGDGLAVDQDVGAAGVIVIDDRAATDQERHERLQHKFALAATHGRWFG